jgi:hypothetical protein
MNDAIAIIKGLKIRSEDEKLTKYIKQKSFPLTTLTLKDHRK